MLSPAVRIVHGASQSALYDLDQGTVFALNRSAARIAELLLSGNSPEDSARILATESTSDVRTATEQVIAFIDRLGDLQLLKSEQNLACSQGSVSDSRNTFREVWLELTSRCNLRCLHCYASAGPPVVDDLPTTFWVDVVQQLGQSGCSHLQLTGGEPFCRKDLWQIADTARDNEIPLEIYSNLTLCSPYDISRCAERHVSLATTLLGPNAEVHDGVSGMTGSFERTVESIRRAVSEGVSTRVNMIVLQQNEGHVEQTLSFIQELGVTKFGTDYVRLVGRGAENRLLTIPVKPSSRPVVKTSHEAFAYNQSFNSCWGQKIAVQPDGTVTPCIFSRDVIMGNLQTKSLLELVDAPFTQEMWRLTLDQVEPCSACEFRYACHDCRPLGIYEAGGLYKRHSRCSYDPYQGLWSEDNQP